MKTVANIYHHTHWDNEWYFTEEDSLIQLTYHMKELLHALEQHVIEYFFLDGQSAILEDYLELHKEDEYRIRNLIESKRLFVGPFHTQIDSFITSGESMINNLRYGMRFANALGGTSKVAYLPDSFGQSQDYPKVFQQLGIEHFVFRRGMGDEHKLPLDFIYRSNDGSSVVTSTLYCGYGFATEPFINHTLTNNAGLDYDGKDIKKQLENLANLSTLDHEFLLPIGNDQTPVIWNFKELLKEYQSDETYDFVETTLEEYMNKLSAHKEHLSIYEGEFINPQYHRVHRSIYSARMDIKIVQDKVERMMALEIQPIMTIVDDLDLAYDHKIIDRIWNLLGRSQTHSAATNTDETNNLILKRSEKAYHLAQALKVYLIRKIAISLPKEKSPIVLFNTLPYARDINTTLEVYTKGNSFTLLYQGSEQTYSLLSQEKIYGGVVRKNTENYDENLYFYKSKIAIVIPNMKAFSYDTLYIQEGKGCMKYLKKSTFIENEYYMITKNDHGYDLFIKAENVTIKQFIRIEESGDEGDNYDYSYPLHDSITLDTLEDTNCSFYSCKEQSTLTIQGELQCPYDLTSRANKEKNSTDSYELTLCLKAGSNVISVKGTYSNHTLNHRVRLLVQTPYTTTTSLAGTQFGYIHRENDPVIKKGWREQGWLEEPSPIYPLLNYTLATKEKKAFGVFTKSSKEYEFVGEGYQTIAITLFRSVGHLGLPDLMRRPGRASGIAEKIIPSPQSQMLMDNTFDLGLYHTSNLHFNQVVNDYNEFVTSACYYQNQTYNRVVFPISYFQTNPLVHPICETYALPVSNELSSLSFSTLEQIDGKKILRQFQNEECINLMSPISKYDMFGHQMDTSGKIRKGEIINTLITKIHEE